LKGGATTYAISSPEDLVALMDKLPKGAYNTIKNLYLESGTSAAYLPKYGIVVVFGDKVDSVKEAESAWWHEQTHNFWKSLPMELRNKYGTALLNYIRTRHPEIWNHIKNGYPAYEWREECCAYFIGEVISQNGTENFLDSNFEGIEEICNFATELRNYIRNGKETDDQLRPDVDENSEVQGGGETRQERESGSLRTEEEVNDPLKAIENEAKRYKSSQTNNPAVHSAKALYDERLNKVETVFTEAYQDSMVSLKTAQNAIAKDQDIPDSQNAYMAENLMHGKNKNEQDLYNAMFRDPLINTINKIMNLTGLNWGDIDRYVTSRVAWSVTESSLCVIGLSWSE
jgi:hypothetical protein